MRNDDKQALKEVMHEHGETLSKIPEKYRDNVAEFLAFLRPGYWEEEDLDARNVACQLLEEMFNGMFFIPWQDGGPMQEEGPALTISLPLLEDSSGIMVWLDIEDLVNIGVNVGAVHHSGENKGEVDEEEVRWRKLEFIRAFEGMARKFRKQWGLDAKTEKEMIDSIPGDGSR